MTGTATSSKARSTCTSARRRPSRSTPLGCTYNTQVDQFVLPRSAPGRKLPPLEQLPRQGLQLGKAGEHSEDLDRVAAGEDVEEAAGLRRPGRLPEMTDLGDG